MSESASSFITRVAKEVIAEFEVNVEWELAWFLAVEESYGSEDMSTKDAARMHYNGIQGTKDDPEGYAEQFMQVAEDSLEVGQTVEDHVRERLLLWLQPEGHPLERGREY